MNFDKRIFSSTNNYVSNLIERYKLFIVFSNWSDTSDVRFHKNKLSTQYRMSGNIFKFSLNQYLVDSHLLSTSNPSKIQNLQQYFAVQAINYYQFSVSHKATYSIALSIKVSTALKALLVLIKQIRLKNRITPTASISNST